MNWDDRYHQAMEQYYRNMTVNLLHRLDSEKKIQEPILFLNGVQALRKAGYTAADIIDNIFLELGKGEIQGLANPIPYYWIRMGRTNNLPLEAEVEFFVHHNPFDVLTAWKHRLLDDTPLKKTIVGHEPATFKMIVSQAVLSNSTMEEAIVDFENMLLGTIRVIAKQ